MLNRHNQTLNFKPLDLNDYFLNPPSQRQRQYETIRAITLDHQSISAAAKNFGYQKSNVYSMMRDAKAGKLELFPALQPGPQKRRISEDAHNEILILRKQELSAQNIADHLVKKNIPISYKTIERVLKDAGLGKLKRRTNQELGKTNKNKIIPERSEHLNFKKLEPFNVDCPAAGVFIFLPYILELGILDILQSCPLPQSSDIGSTQACLSMLLLKLIGSQRLSHAGSYDQEPGLGVFAGLNVLPKPTYMNTYSCRCSEDQLMDFQNKIIASFQKKYPPFYKSPFINIDFHSIPHYGDESEMEKIWCGARGKALKGANTIFAQDSHSNAIVYTKADILRSEESGEIKKFVDYWKNINGDVNETLVFDCKLTNYKILDDLSKDHIKFITLRKRSVDLLKKTLNLPKKEWKRVYIAIPKRKYKHVSVYEEQVKLRGCANTFRQITIKDHGRANPTYILTNDKDSSLKNTLEVYAKRWHIENKLAEMVAFFNLNALSSPIMVRIHFDILWTMIADTLYHVFAQDLRRFEKTLAPSLFKKFINMPGRVIYDGDRFLIKIRKRGHTPILKGVKKLQFPFHLPWLDGKSVEIIWTA